MGQVRATKEDRTKSIWRVGMKQNQHNKKSPLQRRVRTRAVLRMHHVGTNAGSEQSERPSEPHMSIAVEEQV